MGRVNKLIVISEGWAGLYRDSARNFTPGLKVGIPELMGDPALGWLPGRSALEPDKMLLGGPQLRATAIRTPQITE